MKFGLGSFSEQGPRKANEDAVLAAELPDGSILLAVADGLGGHLGGHEASALAIQTLIEASPSTGPEFTAVFYRIHELIMERQESDPALHGMATTLTAVRLSEGHLIGAHCGDTRCVLQRAAGIKKLTTEHSEAQRLFEAGKLTKEQLLTYPRRNVLDSALGVQDGLRVDVIEHDVQPGDKLLITSDGVHEMIRLRAILEILIEAPTVTSALETIRSRMAGIAEDNFSAACAFVMN